MGPQHIGFAIGPFEHVDLAEFRESDEDDKLGQNAIPVHGFCLPGRVDELRNTCLPLAKVYASCTDTNGFKTNRSLGYRLLYIGIRLLSVF